MHSYSSPLPFIAGVCVRSPTVPVPSMLPASHIRFATSVSGVTPPHLETVQPSSAIVVNENDLQSDLHDPAISPLLPGKGVRLEPRYP